MSVEPAASRDVSLGRYAALRPRERPVVDIDGVEIGVFFVGEAVRAYLNRCPQSGRPACQGKLMPRTLEVTATDGRSLGPAFSQTDRHIVCPWHGYEFDVLTGHHPVNSAMRMTPVPVRVAAGEVFVTVPEARA